MSERADGPTAEQLAGMTHEHLVAFATGLIEGSDSLRVQFVETEKLLRAVHDNATPDLVRWLAEGVEMFKHFASKGGEHQQTSIGAQELLKLVKAIVEQDR